MLGGILAMHTSQNTVQQPPEPLQAVVVCDFSIVNYYRYAEPLCRHYIEIDFYSDFHTVAQMANEIAIVSKTSITEAKTSESQEKLTRRDYTVPGKQPNGNRDHRSTNPIPLVRPFLVR
jgi:hypothetical protein